MRKLVAIVMLALTAGIGLAAYPAGYVDSNGYTYNKGLWWIGDQAYTRTQVESPGYWYCGRYYYGSTSYQYAKTTYDAPVSYKSPDWRSKLLDIAARRDKAESEFRAASAEQQYFMEGVRALGFRSSPLVGFAGYEFSGTVNYGANATTPYGYNAVARAYGDVDVMQLFQQAAQLTQGAQRLAGDANSGFQTLVGQEGSSRTRVAEIIARGQVAQQVLQSLSVGPEVRGMSFKFSSGGQMQKVEDGVDPTVRADLSKQFVTVATTKCASCHSGNAAKGGFDISSYPTLSAEKKQIVWSRLVSTDDAKVMPRPAPGEAVRRLTPEELRLFFLN